MIPTATLEPRKFEFIEILASVLRRKKLIIFTVVLFLLGSVIYALAATKQYKVTAILMPVVSEMPNISSKLGGFASLLGDAKADSSQLNFEILKSKKFISLFIVENNLMPIIFSDIWDEKNNKWIVKDGEKPPSLDAAANVFQKKNLSIEIDKKTAVITLDLIWRDPKEAANIANKIIDQVNDFIRKDAILDSKLSLNYLAHQVSETKEIEVKEMLYNLIQKELQKVKLAESKQDYAFEIIDPATVPDLPFKPRKLIIILIGIFMGFMCGFLLTLWLEHMLPMWRQLKLKLEEL